MLFCSANVEKNCWTDPATWRTLEANSTPVWTNDSVCAVNFPNENLERNFIHPKISFGQSRCQWSAFLAWRLYTVGPTCIMGNQFPCQTPPTARLAHDKLGRLLIQRKKDLSKFMVWRSQMSARVVFRKKHFCHILSDLFYFWRAHVLSHRLNGQKGGKWDWTET